MTDRPAIEVGSGGMVVSLAPDALRAACVQRGWSLAELARRARISRPTLAQALLGQRVCPSTAYKLARALSDAEVTPALSGILRDS